ncbi:MAG: dimethylargininase [Chloroflexi bacterium]|nr:dimethylargininase [Chloroflexota bacterium]
MLIAITREISPSINQCELTFHEREPINYERACKQHKQYVNALRSLGLQVQVLPADPNLPDSVFVEDTALVLDECAIITRPGADSRKPETESITNVLEQYRKLFFIEPPARADGGDILRVGKKIYVGLSTRSDDNAIEQMQNYLRPFGYEVKGITVTGCLHLKSAVTQVAEDTLLINPEWADKNYFDEMNFIEIDPSEPYAANALMIGGTIIYPTAFPKTQKRLEAAGVKIVNVDADELAKAEGAVTCCSLIFKG